MLRKCFIVAILATGATAVGPVHAHGDAPPKHGGIVRSVNELTFELVARADGVELYVEDHGAALPAANMRGKLTVQNTAGQAEAELKPAGGNRLEAKGVKLASGDKVVAKVGSAHGQSTMTVRFAIK